MAGGRRKVHEEGHQNSERWLLTYADLITLLLVFFIVMYAMGQADLARFDQVASSLQRAFRVSVFEGDDQTALHGSGGPPPALAAPPAPLVEPPSPRAPLPPAEAESFRSALYEAIRSDVAAASAARGLSGEQISVILRREGVLVVISGEVLFPSGRAEPLPGSQDLLWAATARLPGLPNEVRVAGHTDNVPLNTARFPSNWELSTARALTVLHFLKDHVQVDASRLVAAGYGEYRPIASNETREGRARNRRVEILIVEQTQTAQEARP